MNHRHRPRKPAPWIVRSAETPRLDPKIMRQIPRENRDAAVAGLIARATGTQP